MLQSRKRAICAECQESRGERSRGCGAFPPRASGQSGGKNRIRVSF